jgi:acyl-CoA thioester hydrolase
VTESRENYKHFQPVPTRWRDNDVYGHVNNIEYYSYFDTVISTYLIKEGGLDFLAGPIIGVCAESHCRFLREFLIRSRQACVWSISAGRACVTE